MMDMSYKEPDEQPSAEFRHYLMYDDFGLDYAESLTEGDLRPYVIENYTEDSKDEEK